VLSFGPLHRDWNKKISEGLIGYIVLKLRQKLTCVLHICVQLQGVSPLDPLTRGSAPIDPAPGTDEFWAPIFMWREYPKFLNCFCKWHSLPNMWPVLIEFVQCAKKSPPTRNWGKQ